MRVAGAAPPAVIVPEGNAIPLQKGNFTGLSLPLFKLASILHFTEKLQSASNIEAVTRTLLEQSISAGLDAVAFSTSATGGLLVGVVRHGLNRDAARNCNAAGSAKPGHRA